MFFLPSDPNALGLVLVGAGLVLNGVPKLRGLLNGKAKPNGYDAKLDQALRELHAIADNTTGLRDYMIEGRASMKDIAEVRALQGQR